MILLTGATGKVGSATASALADAGTGFRVLVRDAERFRFDPSPDIEVFEGDLSDGNAVAGALAGADKAMLIVANGENQPAIERQFADLAAQAGVSHLVKLSSIEANPDATATFPRGHHASEQHIRSLGLGWTFLRPDFFYQNLLMSARQIAADGVFSLPFGDARLAPLDARDIGAVAARVLSEDGHEGASYDLTGPAAISMHDFAAKMSDGLGKPVAYRPQPMEEFAAAMRQVIPSAWFVDAMCELFGEIASGTLGHITDDLPRLLGRDPIPVEQFARDYAMAFGVGN